MTRGQCDETGPTVKISGGPGDGIKGNPVGSGGGATGNPCLARDFRLRVTASDKSGISRVKVYLDGKLIKRSTRKQFLVWIRAERLGARRHTIRIVARDRAGNSSVTTRRFNRCDRLALPAFTG